MSEYERIIHTINEQGERLTIQRRLVIEVLTASGAHLTINAIRDAISALPHGEALPETTIYRILQWLKQIGVIAQTDMAQSGLVYQVIGATPHHHLICLNCGSITELEDHMLDDLRTRLLDAHQFRARIDHMAIYGYCVNCAEHDPS